MYYVLIFREMYLVPVSQATSMEFADFNAIVYVYTCVSSSVNKLMSQLAICTYVAVVACLS